MTFTLYDKIKNQLSQKKYSWLVTSAAGFIGSNLTESLLKLNQRVIGIDNFSTGFKSNIENILTSISTDQAVNFRFVEMDIRSSVDCVRIMKDIDYVLHHAACAHFAVGLSSGCLCIKPFWSFLALRRFSWTIIMNNRFFIHLITKSCGITAK